MVKRLFAAISYICRRVGKLIALGIGPNIVSELRYVNIGKDVFLNDVYISAEVNIGDRVMFGPQCMIIGGDHIFEKMGEFPRFIKPKNRENMKTIIIQSDVWVGARVLILKGITIGQGAVIGAGSVVVKDIPPFVVAVGNPCKPKRKIFSDQELSEHLMYLNYNTDDINSIIDERNKYFSVNTHS